ncbi:MAG: hypothetical protein AMS25_08995 [Gemmatimonas sp. SM23_52]|nr:MAG: hypothetical protein AMS25_08995 [Gemmatimonas sp. SM23_52]
MRLDRRLFLAVMPFALLACSAIGQDESSCAGQLEARIVGVRAEVSVPRGEACSVGTYQVAVWFEDGTVRRFSRERDGQLAGLWLVDLAHDGVLDLLISTTSAGSGSYGAVALFQWIGNEFAERKLAPLDSTQRTGYAGHDFFEVVEGELYRSFPLYTDDDPNCCSVGELARFRYSLEHDRWVETATNLPADEDATADGQAGGARAGLSPPPGEVSHGNA